MIVSDDKNYKLDLEWRDITVKGEIQKYLQLSVFSRRSETEWHAKVIDLSPQTLEAILKFYAGSAV